VAFAVLIAATSGTMAQVPGTATNVVFAGSLESIFINDPTDIYSGGSMVVGGTVVINPT